MNTPQFGAMHYRTALFLVGVTILGFILLFFGYIHGSYWIAAIPAIYAWARPSVYRLICDAVYHGHHRFELDMTDREEIANRQRLAETVTLDAESYLRAVRVDDERSGRA